MKKKSAIKVVFGKSFAEFIEYIPGKFGWRISDKAGGCHMASYHESQLIEALIRARHKPISVVRHKRF